MKKYNILVKENNNSKYIATFLLCANNFLSYPIYNFVKMILREIAQNSLFSF